MCDAEPTVHMVVFCDATSGTGGSEAEVKCSEEPMSLGVKSEIELSVPEVTNDWVPNVNMVKSDAVPADP